MRPAPLNISPPDETTRHAPRGLSARAPLERGYLAQAVVDVLALVVWLFLVALIVLCAIGAVFIVVFAALSLAGVVAVALLI